MAKQALIPGVHLEGFHHPSYWRRCCNIPINHLRGGNTPHDKTICGAGVSSHRKTIYTSPEKTILFKHGSDRAAGPSLAQPGGDTQARESGCPAGKRANGLRTACKAAWLGEEMHPHCSGFAVLFCALHVFKKTDFLAFSGFFLHGILSRSAIAVAAVVGRTAWVFLPP